tara:strand:- start:1778 stop:2206 length:429 start_codon:yes stop_codon:yes gene_type:complete
MGKKKKTEAVSADDQMKTDAVNECKRWVDKSIELRTRFSNEHHDLAAAIAMTNETRITWLERAALVLQIDVRRCNYRDDVALAWATSEGDIIRLEESDIAPEDTTVFVGDPMRVFETVEDLLNMQANFNNLINNAKTNELDQ